MRRSIATMSIGPLLMLGVAFGEEPQKTGAQKNQTQADKAFTQQWEMVKVQYPLVAIALLQREAVAYQMTENVSSLAGTSELMQSVQLDFCGLMNLYQLPLPPSCDTAMIRRDYSGCFGLQKTLDGGYEMRTPEEAEKCVKNLLQTH